MKERTALNRATSRANGTRFGRPRKVDDTDHITTAKRMKADGHTGKDIAKYPGASRATLYRYLTDGAAWAVDVLRLSQSAASQTIAAAREACRAVIRDPGLVGYPP